MYNVRFDPAAAGVDAEPRRFRIAVEKALYKEGVLVGQWQTMPVPAQDLFQSKLGYGGSSYPVGGQRGEGHPLRLQPGPVSRWPRCCATPTRSCTASTRRTADELMDKILAAFHKVFANLDQALAHADDAIYPGADGKLYGAA